jgi:hypothetical protein
MAILKLALMVITVFASACDGKSNPAAPTAPAATSLSISGVDAVLTGRDTNYTVTATLSGGTTRAVTPTWTSSNTGVASVDSAGRLVGVAHGSTILTASHEGGSVSKTVQVVNNYEGTWDGRYAIRACDDSGIFKDGVFAPPHTDVPYCQILQPVAEYPIKLSLSQTGSNQSEIRATLNEDNPIPGMVTADGRLSLGGNIDLPDWYGEVSEVLQVGGWDTNLSGPHEMTGRWSENLVSVPAGAGNVYMEKELVTMIRTSTSTTAR